MSGYLWLNTIISLSLINYDQTPFSLRKKFDEICKLGLWVCSVFGTCARQRCLAFISSICSFTVSPKTWALQETEIEIVANDYSLIIDGLVVLKALASCC